MMQMLTDGHWNWRVHPLVLIDKFCSQRREVSFTSIDSGLTRSHKQLQFLKFVIQTFKNPIQKEEKKEGEGRQLATLMDRLPISLFFWMLRCSKKDKGVPNCSFTNALNHN